MEIAKYLNLAILSRHMENRVSVFSNFSSESEFLSIEHSLRLFEIALFYSKYEILILLLIAIVVMNVIVLEASSFLSHQLQLGAKGA